MMEITMGRRLSEEVTVTAPDAPFAMPGTDRTGSLIHWPVTPDLLSGGVLLLGDAGTGKSNVMGLLARQIRRALGPDELMITFDAGGDLAEWSRPGDCVVARDGWNMPEEAGGDKRIARRLARALVDGYRPDARESGVKDPKLPRVTDLLTDLLIGCGDTPGMCRTIEMMEESSDAARYLSGMSAEAFVGCLDGPEGVSMRRFVCEGGGRALFAQSGFGSGLDQVVCAMLSVAICHAAQGSRRVYVLLDDFDRLDKLTGPALDALLNAKNIAPVVCARTVTDPAGMMRVFGTKIVFRASDRAVREAFADACGADCAEIVDFERGCAAVRCAHFAPFKFRFRKNPGRRS